MKLKSIGDKYGIKKQAVHQRLKNAGYNARPSSFRRVRRFDRETLFDLSVTQHQSLQQIASTNHRLNDSALSSLKNFLEMSSGGFQRYLGVILFGQPIFEARLRDSQFRELFERTARQNEDVLRNQTGSRAFNGGRHKKGPGPSSGRALKLLKKTRPILSGRSQKHFTEDNGKVKCRSQNPTKRSSRALTRSFRKGRARSIFAKTVPVRRRNDRLQLAIHIYKHRGAANINKKNA